MPLKVSDGMGAWIDDFYKSKAPQFKGKSKDERRDMAIAAYLSAKRGGKKQEDTYQEAMTAKQKADMDRAMAAFKRRGGKIKKLAPGKAAGYHGKDDPGKGMAGMMDRGDTKRFGTRKKVGSMRENVEEARAPRMKYALVGARDMKIYSMGSDERDLRLDKRSLEKRFNQPLKIARLKTAQRIGDKVDKSQIKESSIKDSVIWESMDPKMRKVRQLATLGLVDKSDVNKLMMAMKDIGSGKEVKPQQRKIIFDAFADLIDLVTGDTQVFQKAKKAVKEEIVYENADKDPGEYDEEGLMMKDQLDIIMDACDEIYDMVEDDENLPEWVQNKVTKAADYIDSARDYLMSQKKDNSDD